MRQAGLSAGFSAGCLGALLAACASAPRMPDEPAARSSLRGEVEARPLAMPDAERYGSSSDVEYVPAAADSENAMPAYPPDLLSLRLPETVVRVRLIVGVDGGVTEVAPLDAGPTPQQAQFFSAVRAACLGWKFSPLLKLDLTAGPTVVEREGARVRYDGRPTALPFHLDYAFRFRQHDGKPEVGTDDASRSPARPADGRSTP